MCTINSSYINANYDNLKRLLKGEWNKMYKNKPFDEDIFHDTLLRCIERFKEETTKNENDFKAYLVASFKNNLFRESVYHRNTKCVDEDVESFKIPVQQHTFLDYDIIMDAVEKAFDKSYVAQFEDWLNGMTIQKLNEKYNCTNARYNISRILKFFQNNFLIELK